MQLSSDYHVTGEQFIMSKCHVEKIIINQIYYNLEKFNHLFFKVFDTYTWTNNFVPCGNIYDF